MAESCEPHIIAVKIPNNSPSNTRNIRKIVVAGGETPEQSADKQTHSSLPQPHSVGHSQNFTTSHAGILRQYIILQARTIATMSVNMSKL